MHRLLPLLLVFLPLLAPSARAEIPTSLQTALEKLSEGQNRWAYTETKTNFNPDGSVKDETIIRIDPSKPYPEQSIPVKICGRAPTEKDFKKHRESGEKKADALERAERTGNLPPSRPTLGQQLDLEKTTLSAEDEHTATYLVPLKKTDRQRFPPEKFEVFIRINKQAEAVEAVSLKLKSALRAKLIAKIKEGHATISFTQITPEFPPTMTNMEAQASASVLFKSINQNFSVKRTDVRRVKPYDERFEVKLGPAQAIDF